jgi:D-3-phosphoglycerate dehydrogenase
MPGNKVRILVSESNEFPFKAAELLRKVGDLELADLDRDALLSAVREVDVLWVRLRHRIDAEVITAAPRLKLIVTPTTGINHIDLDETRRRGVRVLSLRGENEFMQNVRATVEHTLALILALFRQVPAATSHVKDGGWNRDRFKGRELYGKTVGVVGYGRLGRIVARYLKAFDTCVLATDPKLDLESVEPGVTPVPLSRLLRDAELVTIHVNLCDENRGFFGRKQFAAMTKGAWFINTSRGELIDEHALLDALRSGQLAGAAVDVICDEDSSGVGSHSLVAYARAHNNLIITPHIGGCTTESMDKTECFLADRLLTLLKFDETI